MCRLGQPRQTYGVNAIDGSGVPDSRPHPCMEWVAPCSAPGCLVSQGSCPPPYTSACPELALPQQAGSGRGRQTEGDAYRVSSVWFSPRSRSVGGRKGQAL